MIHWTIGQGVPKYLEQHARSVVKKIIKCSPVLHDLRIVLVGAYTYPSGLDMVCGEFASPHASEATPTIYACVFSSGERLSHITDTICHEWGHYEQYRDRKPLVEGSDIEQRTRRLMEAVERG